MGKNKGIRILLETIGMGLYNGYQVASLAAGAAYHYYKNRRNYTTRSNKKRKRQDQDEVMDSVDQGHSVNSTKWVVGRYAGYKQKLSKESLERLSSPVFIYNSTNSVASCLVGRQDMNAFYVSMNDTKIADARTQMGLDINRDCQFYLKTVYSTTLFTNFTNTPITGSIYLVATIEDNNYFNPITCTDIGLSQQNFTSSGVAVTGLTVTRLHQTLGANKLFKQHFKIIKTCGLQLSPGETRKFQLSIHYNKFVNSAMIAKADKNFKGYTYYCILVHHGTLVCNDNSAVCTTTDTKIGYVTSEKVELRAYSPKDHSAFVVNGSSIPQSTVTPKIINPDTGLEIAAAVVT